MDIIPARASKILTKGTTFPNYIFIVDAYSKLSRIYGMEVITTEEVVEKLDMFQARFGKVDDFFWWGLEIIQTDAGMQFTLKDFQEGLSARVVRLTLAAPDYKETNKSVEVTWRNLRNIEHSIMVNEQVLDEYINIVLMYTTHHIFTVLPSKHLVNRDG